MSVKGKNALVTGGSRGIGLAITRALAEQGAKVWVCGRNPDQVAKVAQEVDGVGLVFDVLDRSGTDVVLRKLIDEGNVPSILVNNAGIAMSGPVNQCSDDAWDNLWQVNVTAPFRMCRTLLPDMIKSGWGRIINVASNAGLSGYKYSAAYCATKHAVVGFTRALAQDLARTGVTINALCPGFVETDMFTQSVDKIRERTGRSAEEAKAALASLNPQGRVVQPDEVAHWAIALCEDAARSVHGQTITIDGGQVAA